VLVGPAPGTRSAAGALALQCGFGHPHHLFGDAVRLMLQRIVDLSDCELSLEERGSRFESAWPVGRKQRDLAEIP
jgi:hypothetical protein